MKDHHGDTEDTETYFTTQHTKNTTHLLDPNGILLGAPCAPTCRDRAKLVSLGLRVLGDLCGENFLLSVPSVSLW
jgi:hypothetical protein